jgi:transcription elongation factor GreA
MGTLAEALPNEGEHRERIQDVLDRDLGRIGDRREVDPLIRRNELATQGLQARKLLVVKANLQLLQRVDDRGRGELFGHQQPPIIFKKIFHTSIILAERNDHVLSVGDPRTSAPERLGQAISDYLSRIPLESREDTARELGRFARWLGVDVPLARITPIDVQKYQEQFPESSVDINRRLEPVKIFLTSLKTQKLTSVNLGAHIRLRRPSTRRRASDSTLPEPEQVLVTEQGFAALTAELNRLETDVRPEVTEQLRRAAADKDFRENAPYDAAKQRLSEIQTRINDIRRTLAAASIFTGDSTETVELGTTVTLHSLVDSEDVIYNIVGPGEVNPREGKISVQSPLGRAVADRRVGDVVDVQTPAGSFTYRIDKIERLDRR